MLFTTIFLALLIALAAAVYVAWPLLNPQPPPVLVENDQLADLVERKDSILIAIKELEFDHQVGKISDEDFERFNLRLRRQAIAYIQQIEQLAPQSQALDQALEAEIATMRKTQGQKAETAPRPADIDSAPSTHETASFCTNCGKEVASAHNFCAHCGTPVHAAQTVLD
ncbi:MAG: zinc ribbon domain-containing protein [Caldilineaceae bacterium]|nr:zinc ribbon domain-containing protein [Caldilineaceae bacterium]